MAIDVSTIIPTFRRPTLLAATLESVRFQRGVELEIIVVDDSPEGSARATVETLGDSRIHYLHNPTPTGGYPSRVRNIGWPRARGAFVHFLDDDDMIPDDHYASIKSMFDRHPGIGVVFGRVQPFGDAPEKQMAAERTYFADAARRAAACRALGHTWGYTARMVFDRAMFVGGAAVARRECVEGVGGFDPRIRLREDVDFYARMISKYGACYIDQVFLLYRIGSPSMMHTPSLSADYLSDLEFGRRLTHLAIRTQRGFFQYVLLKASLKLTSRIL